MFHGVRNTWSKTSCQTSAVWLTLLCLQVLQPLPVAAQSRDNLDLLIFDPVLIDPESGQEINSPQVPVRFLPMPENEEIAIIEEPDMPPPSALQITRNIDAYQESVNILEAEGGPFSPDLFEILVDLATQYQLGGEHETAIAVLERAEHISRVNYGLYHPEQYTSIEKMIESYFAMGDYASANQKQRYLVYLSQQHYGQADPNTLTSLVDLAEYSMENYNRSITTNAPVISFTSSSSIGPGSREPTPKELAFRNLYTAQQNYMRAIGTMLKNQQYFDPLLLKLEYNFLETLLLISFRSAILDDPHYYLSAQRVTTGTLVKYNSARGQSSGYSYGKDAFERILIYIRNNPEAKIYQLINALMEYGDWNMLFGRTSSAMEKYREAYALVQNLDVEAETVEAMFRPAMPVHLPLITPKPNSRDKFGISPASPIEYEGYIDIAFTISRYGRAKRFDVVNRSDNVSSDIQNRLKRYLRNSPFRPHMTENEEFESSQVVLRYYYAFADRLM